MTKTEALKKLNTLLRELNELPKYIYKGNNNEFNKWQRKAGRYIEEVFVNKNGQSTEFCNIIFEYKPNGILSAEYRNQVFSAYNAKEKLKAKGLIESFIEEVEEWENTPEEYYLIKINHFIRSLNLCEATADMFNRFGVNEHFEKLKLELKSFLKTTFGETSDELIEFKKIRFLYTGQRGIQGVQVPLDISTYKDGLKSTKILLEVIKENVPVLDLSKIQSNTLQIIPESKNTISKKVFIVHGHDNGAKQEVARFLEKLGLDPIILHEQVSGQKTIIEKIEEYAGQVGFGIVLYTACDMGGKDKDSLQLRARQNVVFEHGYLIGLLGRNRVCPLVKGNVETPGDISGVVYTHMDDNGSWHLPLAKELNAAGYVIDPSKLF